MPAGACRALRQAGVEVAGMASRTDARGASRRQLQIPNYSTDWRPAGRAPDIVAVGTPGGTHLEMISAALEAGCHVLADKPLATTAADASALRTGAIKGREDRLRRQLLVSAAGALHQGDGSARESWADAGNRGVSHFNWPPLMPFGWPHRLETGGGRLNNNFPHKLAIAQKVLGGEVLACMGESRNDLQRVPSATRCTTSANSRAAMTPEQAAGLKWAEVDSDWSYTALVRVGDPAGRSTKRRRSTFRHSALRLGPYGDYFALYGEKGRCSRGTYMQGPMFLKTDGPTWEELAIPLTHPRHLPDEEDHTQRNWNQLAREFVADIRGERTGYLTFRDGWIYQEVIDVIRSNRCWVAAPR